MVVCFIGDSLTLGIGDSRGKSWVGRLAHDAYAKNPDRVHTFTVYNLGLRGESSLSIRARWRQETDRRRRPGEDMAFVFSFGAADGLHKVDREQTLAASREILSTAASLGTTLYVAPPPAYDKLWSAHIRETGMLLRGISEEIGVPSTDFYAPLAVDTAYVASLAADGIHPDADGYDRMADILRQWEPMRQLMGL